MKYLEHRRHTERSPPNVHINQKGIDLAKHIAGTTVPFHYVLTSSIPRAVETALVLGYAVNRTDDLLFHYKPELLDELGNNSFSAIAKAIDAGRYTFSYAFDQLNLLKETLNEVSEGETVLVISHGNMVEIGLVAMFPNMDYGKWGKPFSYLEGYRVTFDDGEFKNPMIIRTS